MAVEWQLSVVEARKATGFTGEDISRSINAIGEALRFDHRADFYAELGSLSDPGRFDAFLNNWWTQALADSATDEETCQSAIDFADVAVSLYARAMGGPTSTQEQVEAMAAGSETS